MARFAKPLQGSFSPVAKHPQKHKNRPEIGRFSHFNPSAEMHPFSLFSASKAPEKWLCDAICRKKQLFPTSRSGFLILHECLHKTQKKDPLTRVLFLFQMVEISTRSTSASVLPLRRHFTSTCAVSMAVRHGMESSTALRRIFTLSWEGMRPFEDVEIT